MSREDYNLFHPFYKTLSPDIQELFDQRMRSGKIGILLIMDREALIQDLTGEEKTPVSDQQNISPSHIITSSKHQIQYEKLLQEFNRQVATLLRKGYPILTNLGMYVFCSYIEPLRKKLPELATQEFTEVHIPFVIVIKNDVIGGEKAMPLIELEDKKGYTNMSADEIKNFKPIEGVKIPNGKAYLAVDIETGKTSLGKTPDEAIKNIKSEARSPLTLEEGVALITHHPEILKDHYVWMPGSRHGADRVAYLWLSGGRPELRWHWANDSSAKWGSASCGSRVGLDSWTNFE